MGAFVEHVNVPSIGQVAGNYQEIVESFDYARNYADTMRDTLNEQIENLSQAIDPYQVNFDSITSTIDNIPTPGFPTTPDININLNENWPDNNIPEPNLVDINADFAFIDPVVPDDLDASFDFTPGIYSSCIWDQFCEKIRDGLLNGGTGLTTIVYNAIIARNAEARRNVEDQARRRAVNAVGARGFDLPGGMAAAVLLEIEREIIIKDFDAINSTTIKDFEVADANEKFIKDLALKAEQMLREEFNKSEDRLLNIAQVGKEIAIKVYEQNVKIYLSKWEGIKAKIEAAAKQIDALIAKNDGEIKTFLGRADVLKAQITAIAEENKAKTDVAQAKASIYESEVRAIASEFQVLVEKVKAQTSKWIAETDSVVNKEKIKLAAFQSANDLAAKVSESIANIASQSVASALGAINTGMSFGYSGHMSITNNKSLSNQLSESHSYKES